MPSNRRAQSIIGLLIALVIVIFMFVVLLKNRKPDAAHDSLYKEAGVDTSNYKSVIDSARKIAADASKPRE